MAPSRHETPPEHRRGPFDSDNGNGGRVGMGSIVRWLFQAANLTMAAGIIWFLSAQVKQLEVLNDTAKEHKELRQADHEIIVNTLVRTSVLEAKVSNLETRVPR